jgi:hypothetical protein
MGQRRQTTVASAICLNSDGDKSELSSYELHEWADPLFLIVKFTCLSKARLCIEIASA